MGGGVLARSRARTVCACLVLVAGLTGCAAAGSSTITVAGTTLSIYAAQPPNGGGGQEAKDVIDAEQLALKNAQYRAGKFKINFVRLDGKEVSDNARTAIEDQSAIAYLGEIEPGTSPVSLQITNQQGLLQVSPTDTASFLTQISSAVPGSPTKYYPGSNTYHQTFGRVVPTTIQEASDQVSELEALHVGKLYVASDGSPYGASVAFQVAHDTRGARPAIAVVTGSPSAAKVSSTGAEAVFFGANSRTAATRFFDSVASTSPSVKLLAASGLYNDAFVSGLASAAQRNLYVSSPGFMTGDLPPAGVKFVSDFRSAYGHDPAPEAIFGYEAMAALLSVIRQAGSFASNRADVVRDFRALKDRASVLGTYSLDNGDTNLAPFVFSRVQSGQLTPFKFFAAQG
jgi:ABC-type branched-subunit amino acid transport system substrate-binding protein